MEPNQAEFSKRAGEVWETLSDEERKAIKKDYPFRADRNHLIRKLKSRGVTVRILAEISGFGMAHTERICNGRNGAGKKVSTLKILESKIQELLSLLKMYFDENK
jgi:hypothetical protein